MKHERIRIPAIRTKIFTTPQNVNQVIDNWLRFRTLAEIKQHVSIHHGVDIVTRSLQEFPKVINLYRVKPPTQYDYQVGEQERWWPTCRDPCVKESFRRAVRQD